MKHCDRAIMLKNGRIDQGWVFRGGDQSISSTLCSANDRMGMLILVQPNEEKALELYESWKALATSSTPGRAIAKEHRWGHGGAAIRII